MRRLKGDLLNVLGCFSIHRKQPHTTLTSRYSFKSFVKNEWRDHNFDIFDLRCQTTGVRHSSAWAYNHNFDLMHVVTFYITSERREDSVFYIQDLYSFMLLPQTKMFRGLDIVEALWDYAEIKKNQLEKMQQIMKLKEIYANETTARS